MHLDASAVPGLQGAVPGLQGGEVQCPAVTEQQGRLPDHHLRHIHARASDSNLQEGRVRRTATGQLGPSVLNQGARTHAHTF